MNRLIEALTAISRNLDWEHRTTPQTIAAHVLSLLTADSTRLADTLGCAVKSARSGKWELAHMKTTEPEPCEDAKRGNFYAWLVSELSEDGKETLDNLLYIREQEARDDERKKATDLALEAFRSACDEIGITDQLERNRGLVKVGGTEGICIPQFDKARKSLIASEGKYAQISNVESENIVTIGSKWNYDRSLDHARWKPPLVIKAIVDGMSEKAIVFDQPMPYKSYGISYFGNSREFPFTPYKE